MESAVRCGVRVNAIARGAGILPCTPAAGTIPASGGFPMVGQPPPINDMK